MTPLARERADFEPSARREGRGVLEARSDPSNAAGGRKPRAQAQRGHRLGSRTFASDNNAGAHPAVLRAIERANRGHVVGYGDDPYTARALAAFRRQFGDAEVFIVFNGTAANCLSLQASTRPYHAVYCAEGSHVYTDECGAPERLTGCKLVPLPHAGGKVTVEALERAVHGEGDPHHSQPRVVSITQATEVGTVYTPEEVRALSRFARERGMWLHMDGARIANAAAALGLTLRQATRDLGVDVLSFGGTKNGLLGAEAVVVFRKELARDFAFLRKQGMQLASKMRFLAVQLETLLTGDLWRRNALHANRMARLLERLVRAVPGVEIVYPVEANGVFARIPKRSIRRLQERSFFYVWDPGLGIVRWMCSFDTRESDVRGFAALLRKA
ncbi:MAG: low specificity L-threonine aldolase [Elusimicrobia bacterium]|nr:low specificity L-threonine aldolase [Elusimicrobiota bacterium]